jgi:hypothetical protein
VSETYPGWAITKTEREKGKTEPETLEEAVAQTVGAASVCWDENRVFMDREALAITEQLINWVERHYFPKRYRPSQPVMAQVSATQADAIDTSSDLSGD